MYLVEAKAEVSAAVETQRAATALPSERWEHFPYSRLSHHGSACCEIAREWVIAMDFAQLNGASLTSGPRWLRARYKWGPSSWPMHWCEVVRRKSIDCGAHAALSRELFTQRGLVAFPAQLVQRYSEDSTDQWRVTWARDDVSSHWLDGEYIYHEGAALLTGDNALKIWDASSASWIEPRQSGSGYGSLVALRVFAEPGVYSGTELLWGERTIVPNAWNAIG